MLVLLIIFKQKYQLNYFSKDLIGEDLKQSNLYNNKSSKIKDINEILYRLKKSDLKWRPNKVLQEDGSITYTYNKLEGELNLNKSQLENRIKNFDTLFSKEKEEIKKLFYKLESINISIIISSIDNKIGGLWVPATNQIILDLKIIDLGTRVFHNVLAHESIHVAQSCNAGSINSLPRKLGLPVDFSIAIDKKLNHPVYNNNSEENILIEREAYSYSNELGAAFLMLSKYCLN